jgi:hypothetical protein
MKAPVKHPSNKRIIRTGTGETPRQKLDERTTSVSPAETQFSTCACYCFSLRSAAHLQQSNTTLHLLVAPDAVLEW